MADAQNTEFKSYNLHTAGSDYVEGSALVVASASGAIAVDGVAVTGGNALLTVAQGNVAHNDVDSGNPVKIGGYATTSAPVAVAVADRVNAWFNTRGAQGTFLTDSSGAILTNWTTPNDGIARTSVLATESAATVFNGTNWDRVRSAPGVTGFLGVGGPTASDAVLAVAPVTIGGRASNASPSAVSADGDVVNARFTQTGALNVYMVDQAGAAASLGGGTQYVEDVAIGAAGTGTLMIGRRDDALATLTEVEGDAIGARVNARGALWVAVDGSLGATAGDVAHDAVDSGNPVKIGGKAESDVPATVADGDRVDGWFGLEGQQMVGMGPGYSRRYTQSSLTGMSQQTVFVTEGMASLSIRISGTWTADLEIHGSVDGTNYVAASAWAYQVPATDTTAISESVAANGVYVVPTASFRSVRVRVVDYTSGTIVVDALGSASDEEARPEETIIRGTTQVDSPRQASEIVSGLTRIFYTGGRVDTTTPAAFGDNEIAPFWLGANGQLATMLVDASGSPVSPGGGTQYVEDVALGAVGSATGTLNMGRAAAAAPTAVSADADAVAAWFLRSGQQVVSIAAGTALIGGDATGGLHTQGAIAHDAGDSGNPVKIGGFASASAPTGVANADRVNAWFTPVGQIAVNWISTSGAVGADGTNAAQYFNSGGVSISTPIPNANSVFNGTGWDRQRTAVSDAQAATGITAAGLMGYNGSNWDRIRTANTGRLQVDVVTGGGGGTQYTEDAALGVTPTGTLSMARRVDTLGTLTPVVDDAVSLRTNNRGALWVRTDGTTLVSGNLSVFGPIQEGELASAGVISPLLIGSRGSAIPGAVDDGDAVPMWLGTRGQVATMLVDDAGVLIPPGTGNVAHDAVDAGSPVKIGGRASSAAPADVAVGDRVNAWYQPQGSQMVTLVGPTGQIVSIPTGGTADAATDARNELSAQARLNIFNGTTWDRFRTVEALDTEAANPDVGLMAAWSPDLRFASVSLATAANSTQVWNTNGANSAFVRCGSSTIGTYIFEVTADGTNWRSAEVRDTTTNDWVTGQSLTPTSGNIYHVLTMGERSLRVRTVATLTATVAFVANTTQGTAVIPAIRTGPAPHEFGYNPTGVSAQYTTTQTSTTLGPTVSATQRMVVTYIQIQAGGTVAGNVQVYFGTGAFSRGTSKPIFDGEFAPSSTSKPGFTQAWNGPGAPEGALDEELKVTTSAAINPLTVTVWYYLQTG